MSAHVGKDGRVVWDWTDRVRFAWEFDRGWYGFLLLMALIIAAGAYGIYREIGYWRACDAAGGHAVGTGTYTTTIYGSGNSATATTRENQVCSVVVP